MAMFGLRKNEFHFLSKEETEQILDEVRDCESKTSGEIRIFIESRNPFMDPMMRAYDVFHFLKMNRTEHRNAVLIYIAYKDHDFALFGDESIYHKAGMDFWKKEAKSLAQAFHHDKRYEGIIHCVKQIGALLKEYFPHYGEKKNELPDEIVFGK
jgi:uncharacterized membrane protein